MIGCLNIKDRIFDDELQRYLRSAASDVGVWVLFNGFSRVRSYIGDALEAHFGDLFESSGFIDETTDNGAIVLVRKNLLRDGNDSVHFAYSGHGLAVATIKSSGLSVVGMFSGNHADVGRVIENIRDRSVNEASLARTVVVSDYSVTGRLPQAVMLSGTVPMGRIHYGSAVTVGAIGLGDNGRGKWSSPVVFSVDVR
jgi:hypothetical protein